MQLTTGQCATLACLLEVSAPKPGNVHRAADFEDTTFQDFVASAVAIGPVFERAAEWPVGRTVRDAVTATRTVAGANTNLGMVLLLAPLARVPRDQPLRDGVRQVLRNLTPTDAADAYAAIRDAQPGGLMPVDQTIERLDVHHEPPACLLEAMSAAADRDLIARQYSHDFRDVFEFVLPSLLDASSGSCLADRIVLTHVRVMSEYPDSLIQRKCGRAVAEEAAARAAMVLQLRAVDPQAYWSALSDLDFWLRSDGHRRNPGTSADLVAAGLFAALRDGSLSPPYR